jgi:hypothetical protein
MNKLGKYVGIAVLAGALLVGGLTLMPVETATAGFQQPKKAAEKHPHIRKAIKELKEAKKELKTAAHDFGGHRVAALAALDASIQQLEVCLKFDKN